ncbi:HtaA domain-containing protein [Streptomyces cyaneus]|uniref:HtaA domain-containing protein n=1 Tax=Streptomyces cyaneus TaxID=1904 RepID=UPI000FF8A260|nr:HtaA domain-containing protein [Streptomyces cyaneus]
MAKRPGAAAVTGGALLALLCPGAGSAVAQDTPATQDALAFPRAVSGGYASWTTADAQPTDHGMSIDVTEPAVRGSTDRAWFPATGGSTDPETGAVDVELGGAARFVPSAGSVPPLTLGGLRLRLDDNGGNGGNSGALYARTTADGQARAVTLADVAASDAGPAVRAGGVTWTGLRASLTDEGARLLEEWSGEPFAEGDGLGLLDVTVGTGSTTAPAPTDSKPPAATPAPAPAPTTTAPQEPKQSTPTAAVGVEELTAGGEQTVTGAGFEPGEVVLVAIDGDTRYQAVADEEGRISRTFPVYTTATAGAHTVEISTVTGERRAVVDFGVRAPA